MISNMQTKEARVTRGSTAHRIDHEDFPSPGRTEALYARIVEEIRDSGLSTADIARIIGVAERQVRNWTSGGHTPSGRNRDRLLAALRNAGLARCLHTRGRRDLAAWPQTQPRGRRPVDMLADGSYEEVLDAVERLHAEAI